ncbi:hypothetical protein SLEP1_g45961 [Rubroshorea leprosula]|uniref:Uncharacterized protein n=1 Tax=Rubroshorea leprosula TaxID=152421 RepID=A0AAV5LKP1_9ROSI|nr:hypothetical protein SLEP1_g45961 [Rubroshorea leprosula]
MNLISVFLLFFFSPTVEQEPQARQHPPLEKRKFQICCVSSPPSAALGWVWV